MADESIYTYLPDQMPTCPKCGVGRINPMNDGDEKNMDEGVTFVGLCALPSCRFVGMFEVDDEDQEEDQ